MKMMKIESIDVIEELKDFLDGPPLGEDYVNELEIDTDGEYYYSEMKGVDNELSTEDVKKVLMSDNPLDDLFEVIDELLNDSIREYKKEKMDEIIDKFAAKAPDSILYALEEYKDEVADWLEDHFSILHSYDSFYNQEVCIDIIIDTGDGNYDFTLNSLHERVDHNHPDEIEKYLPKDSGLLWLIKQQGYSGEDVINIVNSDNPLTDSEFLMSVVTEMENTTTLMNALTFLTRMRLEDAIDIINLKSDVMISKNTTCGLYDPWQGAGGLFEIKLEKDVMIPWNIIDSVQVDGYRGYSIKDIYGVDEEFWISRSIK